MKRITAIAACSLMLLGLSGCALLDNLIPNVTIPIPLDDYTLSNATGGHQYLHQNIDLSSNATWNDHKSKIKSFLNISLTSKVTQASPAVAAQVALYVSDTPGIAEDQLTGNAAVEKLGEVSMTASPSLDLKTDAFPISDDIRNIIDDGVFTLYAVGSATGTLNASFKENKANLTVKPSL